MGFYLAGAFAGIIAIGVCVNIGLTILNWDNLTNIESESYLHIMTPAILTVSGWLVTVFFAFRQIDETSKKNRAMNLEILKETRRLASRDSLNYKIEELHRNLIACEYSLRLLKINLPYQRDGNLVGDYENLFDKSNKSHMSLTSTMKELEFKLTTTLKSKINAKKVFSITDKIHEHLSSADS